MKVYAAICRIDYEGEATIGLFSEEYKAQQAIVEYKNDIMDLLMLDEFPSYYTCFVKEMSVN